MKYREIFDCRMEWNFVAAMNACDLQYSGAAYFALSCLVLDSVSDR